MKKIMLFIILLTSNKNFCSLQGEFTIPVSSENLNTYCNNICSNYGGFNTASNLNESWDGQTYRCVCNK